MRPARHGVVRQARHAAALDGVAAKASAGAVAHVRIATVVNIARAIEELKGAGVWTVGLAGDARENLRRRRFHVADGDRARRRRHRAAAAGPGALRPAGLDPDARRGGQPECVGGRGSGAVRGARQRTGTKRTRTKVRKTDDSGQENCKNAPV